MTPQQMQTLFGLLTIAANVMAVAVLASLVLGRRVAVLGKFRAAVAPVALPFAFVVAAVTMLGSLYFSEVAHYIPCPLCWLQRAVAYPTAIILGIATFRKDIAIRMYIIPLVLIGSVISTYHRLLEKWPTLETNFCNSGASCASPWFTKWGMTLAYMALSSFILVASLLATVPRESSDGQ
jgi:disulfide bond formation protein DsbB